MEQHSLSALRGGCRAGLLSILLAGVWVVPAHGQVEARQQSLDPRVESAIEILLQLGAPIAHAASPKRADLDAEVREIAGLATALFERAEGWESEFPGKARVLYEWVSALAADHGDQRLQAKAEQNAGLLWLSAGESSRARSCFEQARLLFDRLDDVEGAAAALINLGNVEYLRGSYDKSEDFYQQALEINVVVGNSEATARTLNNLGILSSSLGRYRSALSYLLRSLELKRDLGDELGTISTLTNIGNVYRFQGHFDQARSFHGRSLELAQKHGDQNGVGSAHNNLGNLHYLSGNDQGALEHYQKSLAIAQELDDRRQLGIVQGNLAMVYFRTELYDQALEVSQKALDLKRELGDREAAATQLRYIAAIHQSKGRNDQALMAAAQALELGREIASRETIWGALTTIGQAELARGKRSAARQAFAESVATIESLRADVGGGERDRGRYFEDKLTAYWQLIAMAVDDRDPNQAFAWAERAKARVLLEVLQSGRSTLASSMSDEEKLEEKRLAGNLSRLNADLFARRYGESTATEGLEQLEAELAAARLELENFQTSLLVSKPTAASRRGQIEVAGLDQLDSLVSDTDTLILEYVLSDQAAFLLQLWREDEELPVQIRAMRLDVDRDLLVERTQQLRRQIAERQLGFRRNARDLYRWLIRPAAAALENRSKLILIPDRDLWEVPFQTLLSADDGYLIEQVSLSYLPSLSVLAEIDRTARSRTQQLSNRSQRSVLAVGSSDLPTAGLLQTIEDTTMDGAARSTRLAELPEARRQAEQLAEIYGVDSVEVLVGSEATEAAVKDRLGRHRVLHIAAHAILDDGRPMYSHVVLQPEPDASEDGFLEARELLSLDLDADLVVLSACETARGHVGAGEGMVGFSWAFLAAGARKAVVSHWRVDAASTAQLMVKFHSLLQRETAEPSTTASSALRRASLEMLAEPRYRHPFYWAGFSVVGGIE